MIYGIDHLRKKLGSKAVRVSIMINELIDVSEGIRISHTAGTSDDICRASEIYKAYVEAYKSDDTLFTHLCALSAVYLTGRIQGIREERANEIIAA